MSNKSRKSIAVLVVSGKVVHRETIASAVRQCGWMPRVCGSAGEAAEMLRRGSFAAAFSDDTLPDGDFRAIVRDVDRCSLNVPVIVISRRDEWEPYIVALAAGATDYVAFPPYAGEVEQALTRAVQSCESFMSVA
jgi:DNA-binding NtrC family response regulator